MTGTVAARVSEMRSVALIMETKGANAESFKTFVTNLADSLLVGTFAVGAGLQCGEIAQDLPALAAVLKNRADRAEAADRGEDIGAYDRALRYITQGLRFGLNDGVGSSGSDADLAAHFGRLTYLSEPDLGGTYSQEYRGGFVIDPADAEAAGRSLVETLLATTADGSIIAQDEFQIIAVNGGESYILVLPGVIDLSSNFDDPGGGLGLDEGNRSVRDLDRYALPSANSSEIGDNQYAVMVQEAMKRAGIPYGANVAIVGHSYGADTALDLAASDVFNGGPTGYNVTHVVAAAYNSGPQLGHVSSSTNVLVLQNDKDIPVIAEIFGEGPNQAIEAAKDHHGPGIFQGIGNSIIDLTIGVGDALVDTGQVAAGAVVNVGADVVNRGAGRIGIEDPVGHVDWGDWDDVALLEDGVSHPNDNQTVVVFEGGFEGGGHHPNNYIGHVTTTTDPATIDFFESFAGEGYTGTFDRHSVDVSVPE